MPSSPDQLKPVEAQETAEPAGQHRMPDNMCSKTRAGVLSLVLLACAGTSACKDETSNTFNTANRINSNVTLPQVKPSPVWDGKKNKEFFRKVKGGEFSDKEKKKRTLEIGKGVVIFEDIGLTFYHVQEGDTFETIRSKLSQFIEFRYLKDLPENKLKSFNIPKSSLEPGMWIPVPKEEGDRTITDVQFAHYCNNAIDEMLKDKRYGYAVKKILKKVSKKELIATMIAVAKQESGGKPIGQFEFHRWEPGQDSFSFSLFHVLMKGAGLEARKNLDMTEGQLYHPKNAAKLFLAFMCEKSKKGKKFNPEKLFPIMKNKNKFAEFYNGKAWKKINPHYVRNLKKYHRKALELFGGKNHKRKFKPSMRRRVKLNTRKPTKNDFKKLRSLCKKKRRRGCNVQSIRYRQNERMLELVESSQKRLGDREEERLRSYYCDKLNHLIQGQKSGKYRRPRRNWKRIVRKRERKLGRLCK
jgi:hypothetical protein